MTTTYIIPLQAQAQQFYIPLSNVRLQLTVRFRNRGGAGWVLDIALDDGTALVCGLPFVTGHDMLEQHRHIGIPGQLWVVPDTGDDVPTYANLGSSCNLFYVTNP